MDPGVDFDQRGEDELLVDQGSVIGPFVRDQFDRVGDDSVDRDVTA